MSESTTQLRPYLKDDKEILLKILEAVYNGTVMRRHEILWDWWQKRSSLAQNENHRSTVILREGRVTGFIGLLPRKFKIGNKIEEGVFALDAFTNPLDRGIGISLVRHLIKTNELFVGAPVERHAQLWKKILRNDRMEIFYCAKSKRIIDAAAFMPSSLKKLFAYPTRLIWRGLECGLEFFSPQLSKVTVESVSKFPSEVNDLCNSWATNRINCALRDEDYLNWRFADSPVAYEKMLFWEGNKLIGLVVFRVAQMNGRRILLLLEILCHHTQLVKAYGTILINLLRHARKNKVIDFQTFDSGCPALHKAFKRLGFLFYPEKYPILGVYQSNKTNDCPFFMPNSWFISPADSDFEFCYFNQTLDSLEANLV